jgi:D-serine deaminase-like pyridoxal phosphate-dependent protein
MFANEVPESNTAGYIIFNFLIFVTSKIKAVIINMSTENNWYTVNNVEEIDSPALLVYPERVKQNIQTAISMVGDVNKLRPHVKTNKSPDAVKLMMHAGINKFKCATISEAEMLGMVKAGDVLLAYQPTGPKLKRFIELIKKYTATSFACLTDNMVIAKEQTAVFAAAGLQLRIYIDINVGMNRTGIAPGKEVIKLMQFLCTCSSIKSTGLHVYDGHIRNPDFIAKQEEVNNCYKPVEQLLLDIKATGCPDPTIVVGGSPSFSVHSKREGVECSPGTFIYWDKSYAVNCPEQNFLPAAVLLTRVISLPAQGIVTTDLGHKSVAAENEISKRIFILNNHSLQPISQSEEHLVLENTGNHVYKAGDILYGLPNHVCPTVALYERVITIENENKTGEWLTIARDRKISI